MKLTIALQLQDSNNNTFLTSEYRAKLPTSIAKVMADLVRRTKISGKIVEHDHVGNEDENELYVSALAVIGGKLLDLLPEEEVAEVVIALDSNGNIILN